MERHRLEALDVRALGEGAEDGHLAPAPGEATGELADVALGAAVGGIGAVRVDKQDPHQPPASKNSSQTERAVASQE